MAQATTIDQNEQQHEDSDSTHAESFNAASNGTVEQVIQSDGTNTTVTDETAAYRQKLLKALAEKNADEVWRLIAEGSKQENLKTPNSICETVKGKLKSQIRCNGPCGCGRSGRERGGEKYQLEREEEQQWINILSDPLYICLNWLWRNNPNGGSATSSNQQGTKREDVIERALHDANLLEKIALYEHHYSRDEYTRRAEAFEKFAIDLVEGSTWGQLLDIMDDKGTGCLLMKKLGNFNQSLSLLKTAADKERKLVCMALLLICPSKIQRSFPFVSFHLTFVVADS